MNIALTPELEEFIQEQVTIGAFASPSEVIQNGLYLLQKQTELKHTLQKGIDDIAEGRYTTYSNTQDLAAEIKSLGRQQQAN
jgi:putative addiction module CopG family antidote